MNGSRLTAAAERAGQRYAILLAALESVFTQHASSPQPGSQRAKRLALMAGYNLAEVYLGEEDELIRAGLAQEQEDATLVTLEAMNLEYEPAGDRVAEHVETIAQELENSLRVQLERDLASMTRGLRDMALRAQLMASARGVSRSSALNYLRSDGTARPQFVFQDRAGKRWPSPKLVRTVWRQALVFTWNETALLTMAERGVTEAVIEHPDPQHAENGVVISLAEGPGDLTWDQVREDVFHPNTNAWLEPKLSQS
jgi:hypothetical protein